VVLTDGLLITAAEIEAMETVPELVYLSCCHLGQVDSTVRDGNKLAASVARELIAIGVRCVIVAGWAVDDELAQLFGETFYRGLLQQRLPFGDAVFAARQAAWRRKPENITWGAFQAYGDPAWRSEQRADGPADRGGGLFASPEELLDELASLRADLRRKKSRQTERETRVQVQAIEHLVSKRCPAEWKNLPSLQSALGAAWADLGRYKEAREAYLSAIQTDDKSGRVPIKDVEQLANVEGRLGESDNNGALIVRALRRLKQLDDLVASDTEAAPNAERCALQGSAWKRLAGVHARTLLKPDASPAQLNAAGKAMQEALAQAVAAYRRSEGVAGQLSFRPYQALNRLALDALTPWSGDAERDAALALVQQCANAGSDVFREDADFFSAVLQPEAALAATRIDDSLGAPGDPGSAVLERLVMAYRDALTSITFKPRDLDSMLSQMCLMSRFHDALSVTEAARTPERAQMHWRMAGRLVDLAEALQPGSCRRDDRPKMPAAPKAGRKRAAAAKPKAALRRRKG